MVPGVQCAGFRQPFSGHETVFMIYLLVMGHSLPWYHLDNEKLD